MHETEADALAAYRLVNVDATRLLAEQAAFAGVRRLVYLSSIKVNGEQTTLQSPFRVNELPRDFPSSDDIITDKINPKDPYGISKLAAEKIHCIWQAGNKERNLVIVRPGVVFGPGEGGNVTRLIKAVLKNYFFYTGNKKTRKAGVYVKELCRAIMWVLVRDETKEKGVVLFNMTMNPGPSVEEYVNSISKVAKKRALIPSVPSFILYAAASLISFIAKPLGIKHPFSPMRIEKLTKSNNIIPTFLVNRGYQYEYTLDEAFQDWKNESPNEWK